MNVAQWVSAFGPVHMDAACNLLLFMVLTVLMIGALAYADSDRRVEELEAQVAALEKVASDDTQSQDRRGLLMKVERAETRAQKMEQQVRIASDATFNLCKWLTSFLLNLLTTAVGQCEEVCTRNIGFENKTR